MSRVCGVRGVGGLGFMVLRGVALVFLGFGCLLFGFHP